MILLTLDWEAKLREAFNKEHKKYCRNSACICRSTRIYTRVREINKEIAAGRAKVTETIHADIVLLKAGIDV